jgi:tRNA pseudouridine38-40 synthase
MAELRGVLLSVAYEGTAYSGFAPQRDTRTVYGELTGAVRALDPDASELRGASRTDAGVHAAAQAVSFDTTREIPTRGWVLGLNQHLPEDLAVRSARHVPPGYNPRFANRGKRYRYALLADVVRDPRFARTKWRVGAELDLDRMRSAATKLVGTHEFAAFRAAQDERTLTVRSLASVAIEASSDGRLVDVVVSGNAFLYNMVRIIVGTLVDIAAGRRDADVIDRAFETRDRALLGPTAPAHGLTLEEVFVDVPPSEAGDDLWPR